MNATTPSASNSPPNAGCILGIDPALGTTGYGVIVGSRQQIRLLEAGVVRVPRTGTIEQRLLELHQGIAEILTQYRPSAVAIEKLYSHYERVSTAIIMGHARGVICLAAAQHQIPVFHYEATKIKKLLTGNGRASKAQMQAAVQHQLRLNQPLEPADVADALAIALTHHHTATHPWSGTL